MHKKKTILIVLVTILVLIVMALGIAIFKDLKQESILTEQVNQILDADLITVTIDMDIKTKGEYGIVEKTIKEYFKEYSDLMKDISNVLDDKQLTMLLSAQNYLKDGPDFTKSLQYIHTTRAKIKEDFLRIMELTSQSYIEQLIQEKYVTSYYADLYRKFMLNDTENDELKEVVDSLKTSQETLLKLLDVSEQTLNFLIQNKGNWQIENDLIVFKNDALTKQYENLLNLLTLDNA